MESVDLPEEFAVVARRAARVLGLNVAGVDLLEGNEGPMVLEVNSSPGLQGIEMASGVNVAGAIVDHAIREAGYGDVEIDGLLRMLPDEGVVTLQIRRHPGLIGRTLGEVFQGEIETFAIARNSHMMWNPEPLTRLRFDDVVLCTGPRTSLRHSVRSAVERCSDPSDDHPLDPGLDEAEV